MCEKSEVNILTTLRLTVLTCGLRLALQKAKRRKAQMPLPLSAADLLGLVPSNIWSHDVTVYCTLDRIEKFRIIG